MMESSKTYLTGRFLELIEKKIWINISPLDDWKSWIYQIEAEDCMSPFFLMYKCETEFKSYLMALDDAVDYHNQKIAPIEYKP